MTSCHADHDQQHAQQQQRAIADVVAEQQLVDREIEAYQHAQRGRQQAQRAKDLHRPRAVGAEEPDGDQIQHHAHRAPNTVLRTPKLTGTVVDRYFRHRRADLGRQRWDKAVQLAVKPHLIEHLAAGRP